MGMKRKPVLCALTGALAAVSLYTAPIPAMNGASAASYDKGMLARVVVPVPVQVTKGVQQLVRAIPELSNRYVVYGGEVDGPGVSGVSVTFAPSAAEAETAKDRAVFDAATGNLLILDLQPQTAQKPAEITDQQAKAKASSFVASLLPVGNAYQPREVTREQGQTTVRLVRKLNNIALDDAYDAFVTLDGKGRIIAFRTFDGRLYEKVSQTGLPSPQRVISAGQAIAKYKESHPLELIYLLPSQYDGNGSVQAKLTYVVKDGIIRAPYTGSALDAFSGKRLASSQKPQAQSVSINGTGEKWIVQSADQAKDVVRKLLRVEPNTLPLGTFTETYENGQERRFFIWGYFEEGTSDQDKRYQIGQIPSGVKPAERLHVLVEADAKTGQLLRVVMSDGVNSRLKTDKKRDWQSAEAVLKRLLPTGSSQMRIHDAGDENFTLYTADPMIDGIPVYQEDHTAEQGMYTIQVDSSTGKVKEIVVNRPAEVIAPAKAKALTEQAAVDRLLQAYPLELTYIHQTDPQTGEITWKLGYDLSFRQSEAHCFCGGESKVDLTVQVDAVTGKVIASE